MTNEQLTMQLLAIRASVDAMLSLLEPTPQPQEPKEPDGDECSHPLQARQKLDTMGVERWQCTICGYLFERKMEGGE